MSDGIRGGIMPDVSVRTPFTPQVHGFHFDNDFVNRVIAIPNGPQITTLGRCGGMAFAALDYYFAGTAVPPFRGSDFPGTGVPPDGHPLADYIMARLLDSFILNGATFVSWTQAADHPTLVRGPGVPRMTKLNQIPQLRRHLDEGTPVALGLVRAGPDDALLTNIGDNHQVVAYGYDCDGATIDICIYDNNYHDQERVISTDVGDLGSYTSGWRGFFVERYVGAAPWVSQPPATEWGNADSGSIRTSDSADYISFNISHDAVGSDAVEFVLDSVTDKWRKWLILDDGRGGRWMIKTDGSKKEDRNGLYLDQLPTGHVELWKAKFLGGMTKVLELPISSFRGGDRVWLRWEQD
jgi:hypothetical protein